MVSFRDLSLGTPIYVHHNKAGVVRFLGRVKFAPGEWVGVELLHAEGTNDGSVQGYRYFKCPQNHGIIVKPEEMILRTDIDIDIEHHEQHHDQERLMTPEQSTAFDSPLSHRSPPRATLLPPSSPPVPSSPSIRRLWLWGENGHGELSSGDELDVRSPLELKNFSARHDIAQFSLGLHHSVCLSLHNDVYTCGSWISGLLGHEGRQNIHKLKKLRRFEELKKTHPDNPIISICCGDRHSVALHASGELYTWGGTLYGKLGRTGDSSDTFVPVRELQGKRVTNVDCGNWHTAVCTDEGEVYSFGGGGKHYNKGALGTGDTEDSMIPRKIPTFGMTPLVFIKDIVCGGYHTMALTSDRTVYSWGRGDFGQLGLGHDNNEMEPRLIESLKQQGRVLTLAAGENHSLGCLENGEIWSWGYGQQGQLGHGEGKNENLPKKIQFFSQRNIALIQVAAGWRHSIALTLDGHVYSWGHGDKGQLGHGDTKSSLMPKVVESLLGKEVKQIGAGGSHSLAFNAYFKAAQEMVKYVQQAREEKEQQIVMNQHNTPQSHRQQQQQQREDIIIHHTPNNYRRDSTIEEEAKQMSRDTQHNFSTLNLSSTSSSIPTTTTLCVELVYSAQVQLTHRFITFQTLASSNIFTPLIHEYIEQQYQSDSGMVFDNFIVSPGNVLPRSQLHHQMHNNKGMNDSDDHIFDYDAGPCRVTMMIVTRTHADDENLWPSWANTIYQILKPVCSDEAVLGQNASHTSPKFVPCFREIRPAALQEIIQQRQRRAAR